MISPASALGRATIVNERRQGVVGGPSAKGRFPPVRFRPIADICLIADTDEGGVMQMRASLGIALFYVASSNAMLALNVGTCTQGDASRLWGGTLSLLLYIVAAWCFSRTSRAGLVSLLLLPTVPVLIWTTSFGLDLQLAAGRGASACGVLEGVSSYPADGRETAFATIWLLLSCLGWLGIGLALTRYGKAHLAGD